MADDTGPGRSRSRRRTVPASLPAVRNSYDPAGRLIRVEEASLAAWQPDDVAPALWPGFAAHRIVDTSYDALDRKTREW